MNFAIEGQKYLFDREAKDKTFLLYRFPEQKEKIARLSLDEKLEWYAHQFTNPLDGVVLLSSKEFEKFWKWRVLMPMKIKRFFYRVKNREIFKRYPHISEMKKKVKLYSI